MSCFCFQSSLCSFSIDTSSPKEPRGVVFKECGFEADLRDEVESRHYKRSTGEDTDGIIMGQYMAL